MTLFSKNFLICIFLRLLSAGKIFVSVLNSCTYLFIDAHKWYYNYRQARPTPLMPTEIERTNRRKRFCLYLINYKICFCSVSLMCDRLTYVHANFRGWHCCHCWGSLGGRKVPVFVLRAFRDFCPRFSAVALDCRRWRRKVGLKSPSTLSSDQTKLFLVLVFKGDRGGSRASLSPSFPIPRRP